MSLRFGKARRFGKITLDDVLKNPIWVSAHDERHDEEWEKPILNIQDVAEEIDKLAPIITFKVKGTYLYGSAYYSHTEHELFAISLWYREAWVAIEEVDFLYFPATFVSVPTIHSEPRVEFVCSDKSEGRAIRRGHTPQHPRWKYTPEDIQRECADELKKMHDILKKTGEKTANKGMDSDKK